MLNTTETWVDDKKVTCKKQSPYWHFLIGNYVLVNISCHFYLLILLLYKRWNLNALNALYLIINKANACIEESNGNKYLTLVPTDGSKDLLKNNSDNYDEKCITIKFNSDDDLPLKKTIELHNMVVVVRSVFHEDNKCYLQNIFRWFFV